MKLLLILGLLGALIFVVLQAGPAGKEAQQAEAVAATAPQVQVPTTPSATPAAKTHYRRALDTAQKTGQAVEARNGAGQF